MLTDTVALLKDKILVVIGQVKTLGAGSLIGSRACEAEDSGDRNSVMIMLEDLQTCVDHLTMLSVMVGETLSTLTETVVENRVKEDALQICNVNRILALETSIRKCDWSIAELPANIWQAINDLNDKISQKASDKDLEDILEFIQEGSSANPGQGTAVQFQTPLRKLDTYISARGVSSGRKMMDSEPLLNQASNQGAGGGSGNSTLLSNEIKVLQDLLNELHDKVYGTGGSGYTFEGKPVQSQLNVEALLEKELPSKYVLVSSFVCPYILWTLFIATFLTNLHSL